MSILPQFITLSEKTLEYYFPLPEIPRLSAIEAAEPADFTQVIAVYRYRFPEAPNRNQYELQGVEIRSTRINTLQEQLTTLRAENARLQAVVAAAGELLRDSLCVVHDRGKYTVEQQKQLWDKYQAAVDAARSETR